jgi:hypothetical protein
MSLPSECIHCGGGTLYTFRTASATTHSPPFLRGLGSFLRFAKVDVVVCAQCGFMQFFADESARTKLAESKHWRRL